MSAPTTDVFADVAAEPVRPPRLTPLGYVRYGWRLLTSMRTALVLLFLLALAAVPGSLFPQRDVDPIGVRDFARAHPDATPWLDRLSMFDVYGSPWFAAVYLALFVSLAGCVLPRSWGHFRAARARPPAAPRRLDRLPASAAWVTDQPPEQAAQAAAAVLRRRRYRSDVAVGALETTVAGETGYLKETGNLVFHLSLLAVLAGVALGGIYGYQGTVLLVEGDGFVNAVGSFDDFTSGGRFDPDGMTPFSMSLADFSARFEAAGDKRGTAREFHAYLDVSTGADVSTKRVDLRPNHPVDVGGSTVHLLGHGYAPRFVVRDADGEVAYDGPAPFLPQDAGFGSRGVVKVPDARPTQYGFEGFFTPTTAITERGFAVSTFPDALDPAVSLVAYRGDLGLDAGTPQSVYRLDTSRLTRFDAFMLRPGETRSLRDGKASITFTGFDRWANVQVSRDPGQGLVLGAAAVLVAGLLLSLRVRRRRVWVRAGPDASGRTVVEAGGLARSDAVGFGEEFADLSGRLRAATGETQEDAP